MHMCDNAYDEHGLTQTCEFPYSEVDIHLADNVDKEQMRLASEQQGAIDKCVELHNRQWRWISLESLDPDGEQCRFRICQLVFTPCLHAQYTMSEWARINGMKKQSLDRHMKSFRRNFPEYNNIYKQKNHKQKWLTRNWQS